MAHFSKKWQRSPNLIVMVKNVDIKQYQTNPNLHPYREPAVLIWDTVWQARYLWL